MEVVTHSRPMLNFIAKYGTAENFSVPIYILALRKAYRRGELGRITWISGVTIPSEASTKNIAVEDTSFGNLMLHNTFAPKELGGTSVSREKKNAWDCFHE